MGKRVDRLVLGLLTPILYYLFYLSAFRAVVPACLLAFVSAALTHLLAGRLRTRLANGRRAVLRANRRRVAALLNRWALADEDDARAEFLPLLRALDPDAPWSDVTLAFDARPAGCPPLDADSCLALWRAHRSAKRLLVVSTGKANADAIALAQALESPPVLLVDAARFTAALEKRPELLPPVEEAPAPRRRLRLPAVFRAAVPRCLLTGFGLVFGYAWFGNPLYLLVGLALLLLAGLTLKKKRLPDKLFS